MNLYRRVFESEGRYKTIIKLYLISGKAFTKAGNHISMQCRSSCQSYYLCRKSRFYRRLVFEKSSHISHTAFITYLGMTRPGQNPCLQNWEAQINSMCNISTAELCKLISVLNIYQKDVNMFFIVCSPDDNIVNNRINKWDILYF